MDLLVALTDKIIDEDVFVNLPWKPLKRLSKEVEMSKAAKVETRHVLVKGRKRGKLIDISRKARKPSLKLNVSLHRPLSAAYHPSRVVTEV